jgi:ferredoxin
MNPQTTGTSVDVVVGRYAMRRQECIRCASCCTLAPANFVLDGGAAKITRQPRDAAELRQCEAARLNCPADAITRTE